MDECTTLQKLSIMNIYYMGSKFEIFLNPKRRPHYTQEWVIYKYKLYGLNAWAKA